LEKNLSSLLIFCSLVFLWQSPSLRGSDLADEYLSGLSASDSYFGFRHQSTSSKMPQFSIADMDLNLLRTNKFSVFCSLNQVDKSAGDNI
jgi:hypothetical protein